MVNKKNNVHYEPGRGAYVYWEFTMQMKLIGSSKTLAQAKKRAIAYCKKTGKQVKILQYKGLVIHD